MRKLLEWILLSLFGTMEITPSSPTRTPLRFSPVRLLALVGLLAAGSIAGCTAADSDADDEFSGGTWAQTGVGTGQGYTAATGVGNAGVGGATSGNGNGGSGQTSGNTSSAAVGGNTSSGSGGSDPCPPDVVCVASLPFMDNNSTTGAPSVLDAYSCAPTTNEGGPERVYRVDIAEEGLLVASLSGQGSGVDVDVHVLQQLDAGQCIVRGHFDSASLLQPGRYWVVVDSWVDGNGNAKAGDFTLELALNTATDHAGVGLDASVYEAGLRAFDRAWVWGETDELEYGIIDYSMPSTDPRFFVIDLRSGDMMFRELTSHGEGSQDPNDITRTGSMSNTDGSHSSSIGLVRTANTYQGSNGFSLRLHGLEQGYNNADLSRAIVIHGATYATQSFVNSYGYLGRSWGCPAIDPAVNTQLLNTIKDGRLVLKYFSDPTWLGMSDFVAP